MPKRAASAKQSLLIGVDLGGTNVRAGLVQDGKIVSINKRPISSQAAQNIVLEEVFETIATVFQPNVRGIGICAPSVIKDGVIYSVPNIPSWHKVPLQKLLEKRFRVPTYANNDAKCFALGELHYGSGRGHKNLVGMIVGTGLGCGVVIDGKLYTGSNGGAGEIGHAPYQAEEFEHYCSGRFFQREFGLDALEVEKRAEAGDPKAAKMFAAFAGHFANVIMAVLYAYDPEIIVLGGGVSNAYPHFKSHLWDRLGAFRYQDAIKRLKIVQSKKPHIAILAAAALCLGEK